MAQNRRTLAGGSGRLGRTLRVLTALVVVALLLSGCSRIGLAYNWFFQDALTDYVDRYADLGRDAYRELDERMEAFVDWHRQSELPAYAQSLRALHEELNAGSLTPERLNHYIALGQSHFSRFVETLLPHVTPALAELSEDQLRHMSEEFEESNAEIEERWADADMDERVERVEDRLERWIGRLEAPQRSAIASFLERQDPVVDGRLRLRERWQGAFLDVLDQADSAQQLNETLSAFFLDSERFADPAYREARQQRERASLQFASDFIASLTTRQRDRLSRQLLRYADEFDKLAADS